MAWFSFFRRRHRSPNRQYHVILPDGTERNFELERTATGQDLVELSLLSMSVPSAHHFIFSLTGLSKDGETKKWIRLRKNLKKELKNSPSPVTLYVQMLFYPKSHLSVDHKIVKHLLYGQVCTDLKEGRIRCSNTITAQLVGLMAQVELGDYSEERINYMSQLNFQRMNSRVETMAVEQHKLRRGLKTKECIYEFLSIAETLNGYGTVLFDLQDEQHRPVTLACGPKGIEILMGNIQIMMFLWETITIINIRHRMLTFQTETTYTSGTHSFRCRSIKRCNNLGLLCVQMRNYYCNSEVVQPPSRLRRFLSTRINSKQRQRPTLHRTLSNASAPVKYQNNPSVVNISPKHINNDGQVNITSHIHTLSDSSVTVPLLDLPLEQPNSSFELELPTIHLHPTLKEKNDIANDIGRKTASLPANFNPNDVYTVGANKNGYLSSGLDGIHNGIKEMDNLNCINELLEEGLHNDMYADEAIALHNDKISQKRDNGKIHLNSKVQLRSDRGMKYSRVKSDSHSLVAYHSSTMQHPKRSSGNIHGSYHYHQRSDPSRHYHSASNLYRASSRFSEGVVTMAHQLSLATLSQDSTYVDPHIRSLVYESSQADTETEL